MGRQAPMSLRLITDFNETINQQCTLCLFLHDSENGVCRHKGQNDETLRPQSRFSDYSFYTAQSTDSCRRQQASHKIRARVMTAPSKKEPTLRHKTSPPNVSLRELRARHSRQSLMREKQSEERLQRLYEDQILEYLESPLSEMVRI